MLDFQQQLKTVGEYGMVEGVTHPIAFVTGLPRVKMGELVVFDDGHMGEVVALDPQGAKVLVYSKQAVSLGAKVVRSDSFLSVPVGEELLGKVIDPVGNLIYSHNETLVKDKTKPVQPPLLPIFDRARVSRRLKTGVTLVDFLIPLGKGQKELIIGDRKTGKTSFFKPIIRSQIKDGAVVVYAMIGKNKSDAKLTIESFAQSGEADSMVYVVSYADESPGMIFATPFSAMTIAEHFRDLGRDVVIILDDLSTHARFYREVSLLYGAFPGRESYPGEMFYTHARLLERAGNYVHQTNKNHEVSITCFPLVETIQGDLTSHIATNIMGMTDGHIYFDANAFNDGRRPAINFAISVTRVGRNVQPKLIKELYVEVSMFLSQYEKLQNFSHFGAELSKHVRDQLKKGEYLYELFNQNYQAERVEQVDLLLFAIIWSGLILKDPNQTFEQIQTGVYKAYTSNAEAKKLIDEIVNVEMLYQLLIQTVKHELELRPLWQISNPSTPSSSS